TIIKIFPAAAIVFALPRSNRVRAIAITIVCTAVLLALPLFVIPPGALAAQYQSWGSLERTEAALAGLSAMALFRDAGINWPEWPLQLAGCAIVLATPWLRRRDWNDRNLRLQFLGFVLVFCVVFNHRAERQSAVIALTGAIIWYLASPRSAWRTLLFAIVYVLVAVTGSAVVPDVIKQILSAEIRFTIPLTILWLVMLGELTLRRNYRVLVAEVD